MIKYCLPVILLLALWSCTTTKTRTTAESHRPGFHFTPPAHWMNDPNGLVFFEGEYHLFYQYYPDSTVWGPMHWGHAVSKDLTHWEHLPVALYPDDLGYIFSGCVVVDWNNTSGFGKNNQPPLIAIFTHHLMAGEKAGRNDFQYQSLAYSNDRGRTWTKYSGNPVVKNPGIRDFRDPNVIWDKGSQQWVLTLAAQDHVRLYGSPDLKNWTYLSDFGKDRGGHGGVWECPNFFPADPSGKTWVLLLSINPGGPNHGSATQYFIGTFDGKTFVPDPSFAPGGKKENAVWLDYGRDNYAGITFSDIPASDGRRIFIGWMSNWDYAQVVPTQRWRSAMTIPRELSVYTTPAGQRLRTVPVREMAPLRKKTAAVAPQTVSGAVNLLLAKGITPGSMELELEIVPGAGSTFAVELSNTRGETYRIGYNADQQQFFSDRTHAGKTTFADNFASKITTAPRQSNTSTIQMHLFFDRASCELFADGGQTAMTEIFFPNEDFTTCRLVTDKGTVTLKKGMVYGLRP